MGQCKPGITVTANMFRLTIQKISRILRELGLATKKHDRHTKEMTDRWSAGLMRLPRTSDELIKD